MTTHDRYHVWRAERNGKRAAKLLRLAALHATAVGDELTYERFRLLLFYGAQWWNEENPDRHVTPTVRAS